MKKAIVEIEWIDSKGVTSEWEFLEDIKPLKPCICYSAGYLLDDNKDYKTLAQSIGGEQVSGRLTIPAVSIKKIRTLE